MGNKGRLHMGMKLFYEALSLGNDQGQPRFDDVMTGVVIDWNGGVHTQNFPVWMCRTKWML